jgi:hypothetical protein
MKTQKYNKLQKKRLINRKSKLINRKSKLINRKSKLINRKSKLINRKSKLINQKSKLIRRNKKGGDPTNPSIIYLTKKINDYETLISNPFDFNDVYKKEVLQLFKLNIDNVYKCAKMLDFLYEDLDKKSVYKDEYAKYRIKLFFNFMEQLQNNIMMPYIAETYNFYKRTEYYLKSKVSDDKINKEYKIYNKILIKKFINYFHNILSYQTIQYSFSNKSELKIYIEHNSELTNIINQLIHNKIDDNIEKNQKKYLDTIINLFNILRTPMEKISITWDNNNYNNTIIEEILKLYDKIMILAELIQFDLNEKKNRKKEIKSFFISKTYYNNHFIDSKKKSIHENVKYILDYYKVITQIFAFKNQTIINLILNYPKIIDLILNQPKMIDLIFNDPKIINLIFNDPKIIDLIDDINHKYHKAIIDLIRKKNYEEIIAFMTVNNNNNAILSNYLGSPNNNNSQLSFLTPMQKKELTKKNLKIINRLKTFENKSNISNISNTQNSSRVANIKSKLQFMFFGPVAQDSLI